MATQAMQFLSSNPDNIVTLREQPGLIANLVRTALCCCLHARARLSLTLSLSLSLSLLITLPTTDAPP